MKADNSDAISVRNLTHRYPGGRTALRDVSLDVPPGLFGLLGPNGAGKTTLMRILVTLLKPTSGRISVGGFELRRHRREIRRSIGYLPQEFSNFPKLSAREFLDYSARLKGLGPRRRRGELVDKALADVGLFEARDRKAGRLSGGMKRRLGIAQTLIGDPRVIIIDEPTTGLDPEERVRFSNLLSDLARRDKIIILSTHIVGDISSTCSRLALLDEGRIVFDGTPGELTSGYRGRVWTAAIANADLEAFKAKYPVVSAVPAADGFRLRLVAGRTPDGPWEPAEPNLEDAYVAFMADGWRGSRE